MKRLLFPLFCLILAFAFSIALFAHSGRTDSNGGHHVGGTGSYHYHHSYPAHDHYHIDDDGIIDCPYLYNDPFGVGWYWLIGIPAIIASIVFSLKKPNKSNTYSIDPPLSFEECRALLPAYSDVIELCKSYRKQMGSILRHYHYTMSDLRNARFEYSFIVLLIDIGICICGYFLLVKKVFPYRTFNKELKSASIVIIAGSILFFVIYMRHFTRAEHKLESLTDNQLIPLYKNTRNKLLFLDEETILLYAGVPQDLTYVNGLPQANDDRFTVYSGGWNSRCYHLRPNCCGKYLYKDHLFNNFHVRSCKICGNGTTPEQPIWDKQYHVLNQIRLYFSKDSGPSQPPDIKYYL